MRFLSWSQLRSAHSVHLLKNLLAVSSWAASGPILGRSVALNASALASRYSSYNAKTHTWFSVAVSMAAILFDVWYPTAKYARSSRHRHGKRETIEWSPNS